MPNVKLSETTTIEAIDDILRAELSSRCVGEIKNGRLRLVESNAKGCIVSLRHNNGETNCAIMGFMPSLALRAALLVGVMVTLSLIASLILGELNIAIGGAAAFIIVYIAMDVPSRDLVADITGVIQREIAHAETSHPQRKGAMRTWLVAGTILGAVVMVATLIVVLWPKPTPSSTMGESRLGAPVRQEQTNIEQGAAIPMANPGKAADTNLVREYSLVAPVGGTIEYLHPNLQAGKIIPKDTTIVRIDPGDLQFSLRRTQAALNSRQSELALLRAQETVTQELMDATLRHANANANTNAAQTREVESLRQALDGIAQQRQRMTAQIAEVEGNLQQLRQTLDNAEISLPFNLQVDSVEVDHGEVVFVGAVLLLGTKT